MVEVYSEKGCIGCMRSSPVASMMGLIIALFGVGAFGGGIIIARTKIEALINSGHKFYPFMDKVIFGIVTSVAVFVILSYTLAAFSSGYNRKRFFEGSCQTTAGKIFTVFNMMCHFMASFIWIVISCIVSFGFIVSLITYFRNDNKMCLDLLNVTQIVPIHLFDTTVSLGTATAGAILLVMGFIQMLCCSAMNYVRLCEERYYEDTSISRHKPDQILSAF